MNILLISHRFPFPPDDGGRIVTYNHLKHLAQRGHSITFVGISPDPVAPEDFAAVSALSDAHVFVKGIRNSPLRLLANLFQEAPYTMRKYQHDDVLRKLLDLVQTHDYDVVLLEQLHAAWYGEAIKRQSKVPVVLFEHNVETQIMRRFGAQSRNPLVRAYAGLQAKKLEAYEASKVRFFDACAAISQQDAQLLEHMSESTGIQTISGGVDLEEFLPIAPNDAPGIISVASMEWLPNIEGIAWFSQEVLPRIRSRVPEAHFYIVGKNPPESIRSLAGPNISVTGWVDDLIPYMSRSKVFIVPLRVGGGMRIKIINAFAQGVPVLSTTIGAEGIDARNGQEVLIADTAEEFARAAICLLTDHEFAQQLRTRALQLVRSQFSWEGRIEQLESLLLSAIMKHQADATTHLESRVMR